MQNTGVAVIERNMQTLNQWLNEISQELDGISHQDSWDRMRAVLHTIRDRLPPDEAVNLAAQLPLVVRGLYFENWNPSTTPHRMESPEAYCEHFQHLLNRSHPVDAEQTIRAVFKVLEEHIDPHILRQACELHLRGFTDLVRH